MDAYFHIYAKCLEQFSQATHESFIKSGYPMGPFLPYAFENYRKANHKIFFMGQDTHYWIKKEDYLSCIERKDYTGYLKKNSNVVTAERLLLPPNKMNASGDCGMDGSAGFWGFVQKAYIQYKTDIFYPSLASCSYEKRSLIKEIGYSNLYGIELESSLKNEYSWESIDKEHYKHILNQAKMLTDAKTLIEVFKPEVIVQLCWQDNDCFINMDNKETTIVKEKFLQVTTFEGYENTRLFWMRHPTSFHRMGYSDEVMAKLLCDSLHIYLTD